MKVQGYDITRDLLIKTPLPLETKTYKPVMHEQLMDLTLEGIYQAGFQLAKERYTAAKFGNVANGWYEIENVGDIEMRLQVMWQNSYDKSKKLDFAVGAVVLVCSNGMMSFRAMNAFRRKHMGEIQTLAPQKIGEYLKSAAEVFEVLQSDRDLMKQVQVDNRTTAELIGRMYIEEDFLESTQLNIIKRELIKPTHNYNAPGSLWELYNHTTYAIGGINPARWMDDHMAAHKFFVEASELMTKSSTITHEHTIPEAAVIVEDPRFKQLTLF